MSRKILLPVLVILMCSVLISRAQKSRHAVLKDGNAYAKLIASGQWKNIDQGREDSGYTFTIVWKSAQHPETFFWYSKEGGWMTCSVKRAHPLKDFTEILDREKTDAGEDIEFSQVRKGDTLDITPLRGGRDIKPKLIAASMTNRLFFTVKNNINWWYIGGMAKKKK
jgi:hypothetical protein